PLTAPTPEPEEHSTKESTVPPSSRPTASEITDQGTTPTLESEEHSSRKSTLPETTSPTGAEIPDQETSHNEGAQEKCTGDSTRQPSFVRVGSSDSVVLDFSHVVCDQINAEVQVMYVGKNKLDTGEEKEDHLRQVHEMLKKYLPCKKLGPKLQENPKKNDNK
ncbi:uncharacterized protein LOC144677844, partial [Cetorhinus maximus]